MIETFDCEQGSEEWFRLRMGIPTASCFDDVLAKPQKGKPFSKTRRTYLYKLAGEIVSGLPMDNYTNWHMERGKIMEAEARELYAFAHDVELTSVGFVKDGAFPVGCSPDSLIGDKGAVEIKTKLAHLTIECILRGDFPLEHKAQCQGTLLVTGRDWIDLVVYWPGLPLFVKRADRDEAYLDELAVEIGRFNEELYETVERVRRYGAPAPIKETLRAAIAAENEVLRYGEQL